MIDPRLLALCLGNVVVGTGTMVVPGTLPALTRGLQIDLPAGGRLIAAFAATVCVMTPLLAAWLSRMDRRVLLTAALLVFAAGHAASALATSYESMLATRVASALVAGLFTSQAAGITRLLVPPARQGGAVAFVFLGWGIAAVAGTPLTAWMAQTIGWRAAFWLVAIAAIPQAAWVWRTLPARLHTPAIDGGAWRALVRDRAVPALVTLTAIHSWAQFILFAYLTPVLEQRTGAGTTLVALALGLFGLCGIAGNVVAMRLMDRMGPRHATTLAIGCMFAGQVVIAAGGFGALPMLLGLSLWGLGCFSANSAQQARLLAAAPALASVSIALNSSAIYLGQAAGAETGAWIIGAAGMDWLPRAGLPVFVVALVLSQRAGRAHR